MARRFRDWHASSSFAFEAPRLRLRRRSTIAQTRSPQIEKIRINRLGHKLFSGTQHPSQVGGRTGGGPWRTRPAKLAHLDQGVGDLGFGEDVAQAQDLEQLRSTLADLGGP